MGRAIINWGWCPALITALAVVGFVLQWPIEAVIPVLVVILGLGLVLVIIGAKKSQLELSLLKLSQLAGHFNRRFAGNSPLSIFAIIDSLFSQENPKIWDWARACGMSQRIFDDWFNNFIIRLESDTRTRKLPKYLYSYLNELWTINSHYYEFIDQFHDIAKSFEIPREATDQYNKFVVEYNAFVQEFQDNISELRKVVKTGIEPPSVKLAKELAPSK